MSMGHSQWAIDGDRKGHKEKEEHDFIAAKYSRRMMGSEKKKSAMSLNQKAVRRAGHEG